MAKDLTVRQVRVLIYEGPASWVKATIESTNRWVYGQKIVDMDLKTGEIHKSITEHIAPAVIIGPLPELDGRIGPTFEES